MSDIIFLAIGLLPGEKRTVTKERAEKDKQNAVFGDSFGAVLGTLVLHILSQCQPI
jgi:hypothetical protein